MDLLTRNMEKPLLYLSFGMYTTGDACHKDEDGYLGFMGRADDVVKIAGNRIGTLKLKAP